MGTLVIECYESVDNSVDYVRVAMLMELNTTLVILAFS